MKHRALFRRHGLRAAIRRSEIACDVAILISESVAWAQSRVTRYELLRRDADGKWWGVPQYFKCRCWSGPTKGDK